MEITRPSSSARPAAAEPQAAQIAKLAFRRLAVERLEPTPENYERAYRQECGDTSNPGEALATLIERIVRGMERGGRNWTAARRKEGIQRVLAGSRSDSKRLQQRLAQLINSWEGDTPGPETTGTVEAAPAMAANEAAEAVPAALAGPATVAAPSDADWTRVARSLASALQQALPQQDEANRELGAELASLGERLAAEGASPSLADEMHSACQRAERVLQHRHHLFEQLGKLCHELTSSLTDLAENDSWVKGQCDAMRIKIEEGLTARGVRSVSDMLHHARLRHGEVKAEREKARDALKGLIHQMLAELGELGSKTGDFHQLSLIHI